MRKGAASEAPVDLEERMRDLVHLCEGLRALCALGERHGLTLSDAEPVAMLAAQIAAELRGELLGSRVASSADHGG